MKKNLKHGFHLVDASPWPIIISFSLLMVTFGSVMFIHGYVGGSVLYKLGLTMTLFTMFYWWRDIIREGTVEGQHTSLVQKNLRIGMLLFIASEVMFFFSFFWAFFHFSFNPSVHIGGVWPPAFIVTLDPWKIPLFNTVLLLSSGAAVTWCHHSIILGNKSQACHSLVATLLLAMLFTSLQAFEYVTAPFSISDGVYGSTFYMATGFHGIHVVVGTLFLGVCLIRVYQDHFSREHHFGFEAAAWYWHFVDVVWLFLFLSIYWWGA